MDYFSVSLKVPLLFNFVCEKLGQSIFWNQDNNNHMNCTQHSFTNFKFRLTNFCDFLTNQIVLTKIFKKINKQDFFAWLNEKVVKIRKFGMINS